MSYLEDLLLSIFNKINICNEKEINIRARVNVSFMETIQKHTRKKEYFLRTIQGLVQYRKFSMQSFS